MTRTTLAFLSLLAQHLTTPVYSAYLSLSSSNLPNTYTPHIGCNDTTTVQGQCTVAKGVKGQTICDQEPTCQALVCSTSRSDCQLRYYPLSPLHLANDPSNNVYIKMNQTLNTNNDACAPGTTLNIGSSAFSILYRGCFSHVNYDPQTPRYPTEQINGASVDTCAQVSQNNIHTFFGLQVDGSVCWGSDDTKWIASSLKADESKCNQVCLVNRNQWCGSYTEANIWQNVWTPVCIPCTNGYYSPNGAPCQQAPAGSYVPPTPTGASAFINCTKGSYSAAGATSCTTCASGYYSPTDAATRCLQAPAGTYAPPSPGGATGYINCTAGSYAPAGATSCTTCPNGYYSPTATSAACLQAPAGTYVPPSPTGGTSFINCTAGTAAPAGASLCTICQNGYYGTSPNAAACLQAPAGTYVGPTPAGATTFINCTKGSFAAAGASSCTQCDITKGQSCPVDNMGAPNRVPDGKTAQTPLDTNFQPCPVGTYRGNVVFTSCTKCPKGYYAARTGQQSCSIAPGGYYVDTEGATATKVCPAGSFSYSGSDSCTPCAPGTYSDKAGTAYCTWCKTGSQSQPVAGQTSCFDCPKYSFAYAVDMACQQCPLCAPMYSYLGGQIALNNLRPNTDSDWTKLVGADKVGIDIKQGKAGVLTQLATCYNINSFQIDDPKKDPTQQCTFAQAPTALPPWNPDGIPTPAPTSPPTTTAIPTRDPNAPPTQAPVKPNAASTVRCVGAVIITVLATAAAVLTL